MVLMSECVSTLNEDDTHANMCQVRRMPRVLMSTCADAVMPMVLMRSCTDAHGTVGVN